ncbi:hypothetical protein CHCC15291_1305 [Bacillus licheniformis]|nr:hypothetical protein CHCC15291_1305 [Bacillus licheniformis]
MVRLVKSNPETLEYDGLKTLMERFHKDSLILDELPFFVKA